MKKSSKEVKFNNLKDAMEFLKKSEVSIQHDVKSYSNHVVQLTGFEPNHNCRPMDVVKIVCPLIENEVNRILDERDNGN